MLVCSNLQNHCSTQTQRLFTVVHILFLAIKVRLKVANVLVHMPFTDQFDQAGWNSKPLHNNP